MSILYASKLKYFQYQLPFQIFLVVTWNFELYMLPLMLLLIFAKNLLFRHVTEKIMKDRAISSESTVSLTHCSMYVV